MLIVDKRPKSSNILSASSAAINGFSIFGKSRFLIDDDGKINSDKLFEFEKNIKIKIIFGFTFNIYKYLLEKNYFRKINFDKTIILHGGGWKKLENKKIEKKFNNLLIRKYNLERVINYYGLVEQTGSIFMECAYGYFHCSNYSDIYIVDKNFKTKKMVKRYCSTFITTSNKLSWS